MRPPLLASIAALGACSMSLLASSAAGAETATDRLGGGGAGATTLKQERQNHRALGSKGSKASRTSKGSSSKGGSSKGGSSKGKGKGGKGYSPPKERAIYETVEFVIISDEGDDELCGDRDDVANDLESAFLDFFEAESDECGDSDFEVESLVLATYKEPPSCSWSRRLKAATSFGGAVAADDSRRLQNTQRSSGRFNRVSKCTRCRRRLLLDDDQNDGPLAVHRELGSKGSKGGSKSKGGKGGSKSKGGSSSSPSSSSCDVDPTDFLVDAGFSSVRRVRITSIDEVDCSQSSRQCTSTRDSMGACCGACGCACSYPSESLCEAQDYCVGVARPFEEDFCEDFAPDNNNGGFTCRKERCGDGGSSSSKSNDVSYSSR